MKILYGLLIFSIPFNGIKPIVSAGELQGDAFFYVTILFNIAFSFYAMMQSPAIPIGAAKRATTPIVIILAIFLAYSLININSMMESQTNLRSGISKFVVSYGGILYYTLCVFCIAAYAQIIGIRKFIFTTTELFYFVGCFFCILIIWESASWFVEPLRSAFVAFRSLFAERPQVANFRLTGVSFEPSFFAISILITMPWVLVRALRVRNRWSWLVLCFLLFGCVISGARTAYVGLLFLSVALFALRVSPRHAALAAVGILVVFALGVVVPLALIGTVGETSGSVSDVTRTFLASQAVATGFERPLGVGFGQVGFYVLDNAGLYTYRSWELQAWVAGDRLGQLVPLYSWFGRTIGELGISGYVLLAISTSVFLYRLYSQGAKTEAGGEDRHLFFITVSQLAVFFGVGFSTDSYKFPALWIAFVCLGAFSYSRYLNSKNLSQPIA